MYGAGKVINLGTFNTQQEAASAYAMAFSHMYKKEQTTEVFCEQFSLLKEKIQQVLQHKRKPKTVSSLKYVLLLLYYA
jgi:glutamate-1-semialdehyde aminotransferase